MATTNDAMFTELSALYPTAGQTLGDLLYAFWSDKGLQYRGTLQSTVYLAGEATGATLGDLANNFWSDHDYLIFNLQQEDGNDFLLENGDYILMEANN
jgi:phosphodiesterase/alkaline phosphatase D-like protein